MSARARRAAARGFTTIALAAALACGSAETDVSDEASEPAAGKTAADAGVDREALQRRAAAVFGTLPQEVPNPRNPFSQEKLELGRMLYYDTRLSKDGGVSCDSCHLLDRHGVDGEPTSEGHAGQRVRRNAPSVYNAALHVAQFWDGRAADLEEQAMAHVTNPAEMAMDSPEQVVEVLESIPGYRSLFHAAFPDGEGAVSFENMARAIAAFERKLMTPSAFDAFLAGDTNALTEKQLDGLKAFIDTGCVTCHQGPAIGGGTFQKLGLVKPYGSEDAGRFEVTGKEADRNVFKVPSLRNVAQTAPYFHDGSVETLDAAIRIMAEHQLGKELSTDQVSSIRAFLATLTGRIDPLYIAKPELPESGSDAPASGSS